MTTPTIYLNEANAISQTFRKQIRRRDIDARFAKRRQQLLEEQRNELLDSKNKNYCSYISSQFYAGLNKNEKNVNEIEMGWRKFEETVGNIEREFLEKSIIMADWIYFLAKGSVEMQGAKIVSRMCYKFFVQLYDKYVSPQSCDSTRQQQLGLLIIVNILTLAQPNSSENMMGVTFVQVLNYLSSEDGIGRIFGIVLEQGIPANTKQYALDLIFNIISVSQVSFLENLINCEQYAIMNSIFNIVFAKPCQVVVIQVLRCYYILLKRLNWPQNQKVGKIRKLLSMTIRNVKQNTESCYNLLLVSTLCLEGMLRSLGSQRANVDNGYILPILLQKSYVLNRQDLTIHTLNVISLMLNKNDETEKKILLYLQKTLIRSGNMVIQVQIFKILYDVFLNSSNNVSQILLRFPQILTKMQQLFYSDFSDISVNVEISLCMSLLAIKIKGVEIGQINKIKNRIQELMNVNEIDQKYLKDLGKAQGMIEDGYCFGEY